VVRYATGDYFLRANLLKSLVTIGCSHSHKGGDDKHSYELTYDVKKVTEGIRGSPVTAKFGGSYKLTDTISLKTKLEAAKEVMWNLSWVQKVDDHLTITAGDACNLTNMISDPKNMHYNFSV